MDCVIIISSFLSWKTLKYYFAPPLSVLEPKKSFIGRSIYRPWNGLDSNLTHFTILFPWIKISIQFVVFCFVLVVRPVPDGFMRLLDRWISGSQKSEGCHDANFLAPEPPVMIKLASWQFSVFSDFVILLNVNKLLHYLSVCCVLRCFQWCHQFLVDQCDLFIHIVW